MKALFRKLLSPTALIIIILIIEVAVIVFGVYFVEIILSEEYEKWGHFVLGAYRFLAFAVEVLIYFLVIRKDENPEFKIPWITFLVLFPIFTAVMYVIFANHGLRPKERKIVPSIHQTIEKKFVQSDEQRQEFKNDVEAEYQGIFKYLKSVTHLHANKNNHITYYKNGETFFPAFIEELKKAKEFIFMEFFIIGEGKEWSQIEEVLINKAKEGVEVRLLYDDMGSFGTLPSGYDKKMRKLGIKCYRFSKFRPILSGMYNNRDHRKIAVIDHQMAFTGGMNLADEYANDIVRFGYWKDTMVKVEGPSIANFIATFLSNYDITTRVLSDYDKYLDGEYPHFDEEGYAFFFGDGPGSFDDAAVGELNYINLINAAKKTLYISTPYLIMPYPLLQALRTAAQRGVDVKLFVPGIPDKRVVYWMAKCDFYQLTKYGVHIYTYTPGFNHEKQLVADDILAFCGTINFDFRSLVHHFECGITLYKSSCIKEMKEDFYEMEAQSKEVPASYRPNAFLQIIATILKIFRTLL